MNGQSTDTRSGIQTDSAENLAPVFRVLGDPIRCRAVGLLGSGPRRAGELAAEVGVDPPTMSRHLKVLLSAGIATAERRSDDARVRIFRLEPGSLTGVQAWLDQLQAGWAEQLDSFKTYVESEHSS